jgi:hypothetical protein
MKKTLVLLLAILTSIAGVKAQSFPKDSLYYVHLKDGSTLYSNKVNLVSPFLGTRYLLIDSNKHIPLSQVKDFKGWQGTYAIGQPNGYYDAFRLENEGRLISLYSQCISVSETVFTSTGPNGPPIPTTITTQEKALYFKKGQDGDIQRLNYRNIKLAVADNVSSSKEIRIAGVDLSLGIGMLAGGVALAAAGFVHTAQQNNNASNAYKAASANWYNQSLTNPNTPPPALPPHYGPSALVYIGALTAVAAIIPLANVNRHVRRALDIYNGND